MTNLLVRLFIKEKDAVHKDSVRTAYGVLSSIVGIICNVILFVIKLIVGVFLHSISVTADAFNNLSDAASSIISLIGVKLAGKPADEEHPFGHGRIEYISALIVAFLVIEVGFTFLKDGIKKIQSPETLTFSTVSVIILCLSILIKVWLAFFNRKLGRKIQSKVMEATATDAIGDVITTSATIVSLLVFQITGRNIDGFIGVLVALVVMWAGIGIAKDTLKPLIGESIDPALFKTVSHFVEKYDGIVGSHDLILHNYGPNKSMGSIHAEVPSDVDINVSHEIIDRIEKDVQEELGILLVIHMDPIETKDGSILKAKNMVKQILKDLDPQLNFHDFRMVVGKERTNLIFDLVIPFEYTQEEEDSVRSEFLKRVEEIDKRYYCSVTIDRSYVGE